MSEQIGPAPSLPHGLMLANQTILKRIAVDPLGDRYTVLFGTTNRVYAVNISRGSDAPLTLTDFEVYLSRTMPLRHPCLISYFACGEHEDVAWIRSAHSDGAPDWVTASATPLEPSAERQDGGPVFFPTLRALLDSTGGQIAVKDRNLIIGDLAEAIAYLHEHDSYAGTLTPETVFLDQASKRGGLIARLRFYAWPEAPTLDCQAHDLRQVGELIMLLLAASESRHSTRLSSALSELAQRLQIPGTMAGGGEFYATICELFEAHGEFHKPRAEEQIHSAGSGRSELQPSVVQSGTEPVQEAKSNRQHRSSHRRHRPKRKPRRFDSNSATGQMVIAIFRIGVMFAAIVGVGFGVYFGMQYFDERQGANVLISGTRRYSAISIIEDDREQADMAQLPKDVGDYTLEQLRLASERGNAVATARLAVLTLAENPTDADTQAAAESILLPHMSRLEVVSESDPVATYWYGYVRLLGIDGIPEPEQAVVLLNQAIDGGWIDAHILLGDWLARRSPNGSAEADRQAMQHWRMAYGRPSKWTSTHLDAIARIVSFVRAGRGFKPDDAELGGVILHAATAGYLDAMLLVSELYDSGLLLEKNASTALSWLRRIAAHSGTTDIMRAETQRRMADMFAEGRGTPPSLSAARIWYERAAKLGNRQAMLTLAEFCEAGTGDEAGKRSPEEARYWRNLAQAAQPFLPDIRPSRLFGVSPASPRDAANVDLERALLLK